jgi:hypothetical protein
MKLLILVSLFFLTSCSNGFKKFYKEEEIYAKMKDKVIFHQGDPQILSSSDIKQDLEKYFRKGYIVIGSSSFNSGNENDPESNIKSWTKKLGAEVVLWNYKYTSTVSGVSNYTYYTPQTNTSYYSGNIRSGYSMNSYNYSGTMTAQTQTANIASVPYSIRRYDYNAVFLSKTNIQIKFGASFKDLDREERIKMKLNGGAVILMIFDDSLAYHSNLLEGDIVTRIQKHDVTSVEDLMKFIHDELDTSKNIEISYLRDGKAHKEVIKPNKID